MGGKARPYKFCQRCHKARRSRNNEKAAINSIDAPMVGLTFAQMSSLNFQPKSSIVHHIFDKGEWRRAKFMDHRRISLSVSIDKDD